MSAQAYLKQQQQQAVKPPDPVKVEPLKPDALNTSGNRGTALNVSA